MQTGYLFGLTAETIVTYLLTIFRVAGLFAIAPILGHRMIPVKLKLLLTLILSYFLVSYFNINSIELTAGVMPLVSLAVREFMLGLVMGFLFQIIFIGVQFGGGIIGYQIGFALVNVIDPSTQTNISIIAQVNLLIATLIFLMLNGHHVILQALMQSYQLVPLGSAVFSGSIIEAIIHFTGKVFIIGVKIASPVIVTLFITDVCLGIVGRTMPQMNIFVVGFPLKISAGLFILATSLPMFNYIFTKLLGPMNKEVMEITKGLAG